MIVNLLKRMLKPSTEQQKIEEWLADSASLIELEYRQRMIDRGQAPWQIQANNNLRVWA